MNENSQDTGLNGAHIKRVAPARSRNLNGGAEEFQHRTVAHHRDVHDFDVSFYRP
ncbi:MAG: hypothetical protein E6310_08545 [Bifidobacterium breve]|uniref:hypothetical protein n=1 Tax=Bifidobacterium breve TaxID=1685 RepID=UPI00079CB7FD|nr:hypothetical protein [Bifidobacterium breve]KWZ86070.1 hypothetical protein HMPREF3193_00609 [Bifidobacterium breve]MCZ4386289.1 hypothetical protein [Bifidobacterium breve]MCZ4402950.1 hypothetical protein [Bifidobacterium breve]MCZ4427719.1 hypothetical protein [Bifidobacterium breve]MCZ4440598.1 hypothetical protein [Bifidobacterium breve]